MLLLCRSEIDLHVVEFVMMKVVDSIDRKEGDSIVGRATDIVKVECQS